MFTHISTFSVPLFFFADEDGLLVEDSTFPKVVFQMHKWFMLSKELAGQFLDLYPLRPNLKLKENPPNFPWE